MQRGGLRAFGAGILVTGRDDIQYRLPRANATSIRREIAISEAGHYRLFDQRVSEDILCN